MINAYSRLMAAFRYADGLPLLLIRLYLAPVMIQAGWNKATAFESTSQWFGNAEWGLGLPFPELLAGLAIGAEVGGGVLLLLGLFTRLSSIPLIVTMGVAIVSVHAKNGWLAIADPGSWFADGTVFYDSSVMASAEKLSAARNILEQHGQYDWLTASGKFVILNNGIEFAATYLVMLLVIFFYGGGRYVSIDWWLRRLA